MVDGMIPERWGKGLDCHFTHTRKENTMMLGLRFGRRKVGWSDG